MERHHLAAESRTQLGKQSKKLRRIDQVPAVVYGHGVASQSVVVTQPDLLRVFRQAGTTSLIDLAIAGGSPVTVLIHDIQRHPITSVIIHADFYQVTMTEKLQAEIELDFTGESAAVKELGGIFVRTLDKVKVECLPADLVPHIAVDISSLKTFDDRIHVRDIVAPTGITILDRGEEVVASVTRPRSEEEIAALSEKVEEDVTVVGTVEKAKPEDEEPTDETAPEPKKDKKETTNG